MQHLEVVSTSVITNVVFSPAKKSIINAKLLPVATSTKMVVTETSSVCVLTRCTDSSVVPVSMGVISKIVPVTSGEESQDIREPVASTSGVHTSVADNSRKSCTEGRLAPVLSSNESESPMLSDEVMSSGDEDLPGKPSDASTKMTPPRLDIGPDIPAIARDIINLHAAVEPYSPKYVGYSTVPALPSYMYRPTQISHPKLSVYVINARPAGPISLARQMDSSSNSAQGSLSEHPTIQLGTPRRMLLIASTGSAGLISAPRQLDHSSNSAQGSISGRPTVQLRTPTSMPSIWPTQALFSLWATSQPETVMTPQPT